MKIVSRPECPRRRKKPRPTPPRRRAIVISVGAAAPAVSLIARARVQKLVQPIGTRRALDSTPVARAPSRSWPARHRFVSVAVPARPRSAGARQPARRDGDTLAGPERRIPGVDELAIAAVVEANNDLVRALLARAR